MTWFRFRAGGFDPLCDYQTKNFHELFAVAFECWVDDPDLLRAEQPAVYAVLDEWVCQHPA